MKSWLILLGLAVCLSACSTIEFVRPPLRNPPLLKSVVPDKNDRTGEKGFWLDRPDLEATMGHFEHTRNVKELWK